MSWNGHHDCFMYIVTPPVFQEDELARIDIEDLDAAKWTSRWGSNAAQFERLKGVMGNKKADVVRHRSRGGFPSIVECSAAELKDLQTSEDPEAVGAALQKMNINEHDDKGRTMVMHLGERHSASVRAQSAFAPASTKAEKRAMSGYAEYQANQQKAMRELLSMVIKHRADPNVVDRLGRTALDVAVQNGDAVLADALRSSGAAHSAGFSNKDGAASEL
eukprot:TRINITY_DN25330_c0_g2_i2.p1 TRINITY_DN25330_c0_g2~~TRINITY_DN25330_c0_g2_i2.p1  ORF type:complete len:219 (-),score=53.90 TRINITY_DN25330_c0_g2_i2:17-673(-)